MRWKGLICLLAGILLGAQTGNLAWDLPTTRTDGSPLTNLAGTRLWCAAQAGGPYGQIADVLVPVTTWGPLPAPPQYCVATAYDSTGLESTYSNEAAYLAQGAPPPVQGLTVQLTPYQASPPVPITLDAASIHSSAAPADPFTTGNHVVASGATILLAFVGYRAGTDLTAVTWNVATPQSFTKVRSDLGASLGSSSIWYLLNPTAATDTVTVSGAGIATVSVHLVSLFGTDTTASVIHAHNGVANDTTSPLTFDVVTTAANCWVMDVVGVRGNPSTITQGTETGRTDWPTDWEYEPGGNEAAIGGTRYVDAAAGTYTFSWTFTGTQGSASGVAIQPPGAAAADTPYRPVQMGFVPRALRTMVAN